MNTLYFCFMYMGFSQRVVRVKIWVAVRSFGMMAIFYGAHYVQGQMLSFGRAFPLALIRPILLQLWEMKSVYRLQIG